MSGRCIKFESEALFLEDAVVTLHKIKSDDTATPSSLHTHSDFQYVSINGISIFTVGKRHCQLYTIYKDATGTTRVNYLSCLYGIFTDLLYAVGNISVQTL